MRKVLITGASGDLGAAIAKKLSKSGFFAVLHCHKNLLKTEKLAKEIALNGGKAKILQIDVNNREECFEALKKEISETAFYGVVCNAGIHKDNAFPAMPGQEWDSVIQTNLNGFYNILHPLIMPMIHLKQGGRIVTISSISGEVGNRGQTNYSAAKGGLIAATKALAIELGKRQITVNCVSPGVIESDMTKNLNIKEILKTVPLNRKGTPEEVAHAVDFLFSDGAGYITRQVLSVNGGMF